MVCHTKMYSTFAYRERSSIISYILYAAYIIIYCILYAVLSNITSHVTQAIDKLLKIRQTTGVMAPLLQRIHLAYKYSSPNMIRCIYYGPYDII